MSRILNQEKRLCRIANNCVLPELNCITGPVRRAKLTTPEIVKLVRNGRTLYELDPAGKLPEVKLNIHNCTESQFGKKVETPAPAAPVEPEKPVAPAQEVKPQNIYDKYNKKDKHNKNGKNSYNSYQQQNATVTPANDVPSENTEAEKNNEAPATEEPITAGDM